MTPERFRRLRAVLDRRQPDLTVLMDGVHKPHNLSAIARSCDAVGAFELHMVPASRPGSLHPEISAGASKWIRLHTHADAAAAARVLRDRGFHLVAAHPDPDAPDFRDVDYTRPTALVMGSELNGLTERTLALVDRTVVVPMMGMVRSLNVSVASAVLLYEAQRQRRGAGMYDASRFEPDERARILFEWAHPGIARRCREAGFDYPPLTEEGEIETMPPLPGLVGG